MDAV
jgi:hypothetical protein